MAAQPIVPSQIRAGRALVGITQEQLAKEADIGISSLREIEGGRRPPDTGVAVKIRRALENAGVILVPSDTSAGLGVRLADKRPQIIRPPSLMTIWEGMPFTVEWMGEELLVFVAREVLDDLGRFREQQVDEVYLQVFDQFKAEILDGVARAAGNRANYDPRGRLHLRGKDIAALSGPFPPDLIEPSWKSLS
jgi:transcriptional regulator with XRE-family HTH domain